MSIKTFSHNELIDLIRYATHEIAKANRRQDRYSFKERYKVFNIILHNVPNQEVNNSIPGFVGNYITLSVVLPKNSRYEFLEFSLWDNVMRLDKRLINMISLDDKLYLENHNMFIWY